MKLFIAALVALPATYIVANETIEVLDVVAPQAAVNVSDVNLDTLYKEAFVLTFSGITIEEAMVMVAEDFSEEGMTYFVNEAGELVAQTEWSCRKLVFSRFSAKTVDC